MNNVAFIYQPHFKTDMFRVAVTNQQGSTDNFIVVCCSEKYNGIYHYSAVNRFNYDIWFNNDLACYCVPLKDCDYYMSLKDIRNPKIIKEVKKLQKKWYNNKVKNRDYTYKDKPEWML